MNDFYVGYLPKAPTALASFVRKVIVVLGLLAVTAALVLVVGQMSFSNSTFEYGRLHNFEGVVATQPFPTLLVARPGETGLAPRLIASCMIVGPSVPLRPTAPPVPAMGLRMNPILANYPQISSLSIDHPAPANYIS